MTASFRICETHVCAAEGCLGRFRSDLVPFCAPHRMMLKGSTAGLIRTAAMTALLSDDPETTSYARSQFDGYVEMALAEIAASRDVRHG